MIDIKKFIFYSIIILILIGTVFLRFFVIYTAPLDQNEPYFTSKANSINQGKVMFDEGMFSNHSPLASYFLSFYSKLFGLSIISVHYAALLFDILIFLVLFFLLRRFFGFKESLLGSAIYLVISRHCSATYYSSEFPSAFFGLLGLTLYILYLEKNKTTNWNYKYLFLFISGIAIGFSIWFKQPGIFFFLAIFVHQIYMYFKKQQSVKECLKNILLVILGILLVSVPLVIYFYYHSGFEFIYELIIFNLLFKTRHSRIIVLGKLIKMLLVLFGFMFAIILAAPKKQEESNKNAFDCLIIYSIIMLLFYSINRELFDSHFIQFFPVLILVTFFYVKKYTPDYKKLIYIIMIISILTIFMVHLEYDVRQYQGNEKQEQMEIVDYLKSLPADSNMYFINNRYTYLSGRESTYRYTMDLGPNVEANEKFEDFCDYIDTVDYMLITEIQEKYLGEKNIGCIESKFILIKSFEDVGDMSTVSILKNKKINS